MGINAAFVSCSAIITGLLTLVNQYQIEGAEDAIATTAVVVIISRAWATYFRKVCFDLQMDK